MSMTYGFNTAGQYGQQPSAAAPAQQPLGAAQQQQAAAQQQQGLAQALASMQQSGASNSKTPAALGANLLADALLNFKSQNQQNQMNQLPQAQGSQPQQFISTDPMVPSMNAPQLPSGLLALGQTASPNTQVPF